MSQWGAEGYARIGYDYERILAHYYPTTTLAHVPPKPVRVLLAQGLNRVRISSAAPFAVVDAKGATYHVPARTVVVGRRIVVDGWTLHAPFTFEPGAEPLTVDGDGYRGNVAVKHKPDGWMVVNALPLDRYLRGVVPWEAPKGWHEATYQAQAVAARSYTLAHLYRPGADFDLYSDARSQEYGGIRAERSETNLAIGSTAGQVLEWHGSIIEAFYFSSSGGRTSSVHDAWPWTTQVPYLVSVADPYDRISPRHIWPTSVLTAQRVGSVLGLSGVRDAVIVRNSSGRAASVRVLSSSGWRRFPGAVIEKKFHLVSTDFDLRAMTLDAPQSPTVFGGRARLDGWIRGLGKARLQLLTGSGWQTVARVRPAPSGHFAVAVRARRSVEYRIAYNTLPGEPVTVTVAPRVVVKTVGQQLCVRVSPRLPLRVERLTAAEWRPVARATGVFARRVRPGSYRVEVAASTLFVRAVSAPVAVRSDS
jgi:stage II sporulation protein D